MRAVIAAGAPLESTPLVRAVLGEAELRIAADSGAEALVALGLRPQLVVGDMDSIDGATLAGLRAEGIEVEVHPVRKDLTDTHLAVHAAIERGATEIAIVGALGGERPDHGFANVLLLGHEEFAPIGLRIIDGDTELRAVRTSLELRGEAGDYVSLLALTDAVRGIESEGLEYALAGSALYRGDSRGISNRMTGGEAKVTVGSGVLLVAHRHGP